MPGSFRLVRLFGIDVRVHLSWVLIFLLFTYQQSLEFDAGYPSWSTGKTIIVGAITALLFFASVVVHELAHSLVARRFKMSVHSITLFLLGGVASLTREPPTAQAEFLMAAAGPATSLAIGGLAWVASFVLGTPPRDTFAQVANAVFDSLAQINVLVALFNLIPGFPLDGGRVLRATIWGLSGNQSISTRIAARGGQVVAGLFALGSAVLVLGFGEPSALWWLLIAYFLFGAATQTLQQERATSAIGNARVAQVTTTEFVAVPRGTSIGAAVRDYLLPKNLRAIAVVHDGRFEGLVTIGDLRKVDQQAWPTTPVEAVMMPASEIPSVESNDPLVAALDKFGPELPLIPVVENGTLRGLLYRESVLGFVRMREMLGLESRR